MNQGLFDSIDEEDMDKAEGVLRRAISNIPEIAARIAQGGELSKEDLHLMTLISRKAIGEGV